MSHFLGGCTNRLGFEGRQPGDVVIGGVCSFDFACNDALFCNGEEYCGEAGLCVAGEAPCSEGLCLSCQENTQSCFEPADTACDDSDTSTYSDICDGAGSCAGLTLPDCDDGLFCNGIESFDLSSESCISTADPCPNATCTDDTGGFSCACDAGYEDVNTDGTLCTDWDECSGENGGDNCDLAASCTNTDGTFTCPAGYDDTNGDGTECVPFLTNLVPSTTEQLSPAFASLTLSYTMSVELAVTNMSFTPFAALGVTITVNGTTVETDTTSQMIALVEGYNTIVIIVEANSRERTYTVDVLCGEAPSEYIKASNTGAGDLFGSSIDMDGDTLVVGAVFEESLGQGVDADQLDNSGTDVGAVYVFVRSGDVWTQEAYIKASYPDDGDFFGIDVAISGDTLVVGASREDGGIFTINGDQADNAAANSGAVYVFTRSGGIWTQQAYIKGSNQNAVDYFGARLALEGDDLVVASKFDGVSGGTTDSGAVYVFTRSGSIWTEQAYIKAATVIKDGLLGTDVAISADTIVAGSVGAASTAGYAYVFTRSGSVWSEEAILTASNAGSGDQFGEPVAILGDTIAVGAMNEDGSIGGVNASDGSDNSASFSGAAYVFTRSGTVWSEEAYINAPTSEVGAYFGAAISLEVDKLLVGSFLRDAAGGDSGAAYTYTRSGTIWTEDRVITSFNLDAGDRFGCAVVLSGVDLVIAADVEGSKGTGVGGEGLELDNSFPISGAIYINP